MESPTNPSPSKHSRAFDLRLILAALLLLPAIWFSWKTVDGLAARRLIRTDLAEITHARYGILSADQWRTIIGPILNAQVDKLDLKSQNKSLRPMVERSLYALLDNIKTQMTSPQAKTSETPGGGNAFLVNMIVASLRPHVPEYTEVVMKELAKPQTQEGFKDSIRGVLADAVKNTFSPTDMTTYNAILNRYGCADGTACELTLGKQIEEADKRLTRYYLTVLATSAVAFILLMAGKSTLSRGAVVVLMLFSIAMLAGGVLSPMLEVEVRVSKLDATLLGAPIEFRDQSLYYRSKTVLEVCQTLIQMRRPEMMLVGVLVILFSVVFPVLKMLALGACVIRPALLRTNRLVKLLAFELSKWSMADVMVLAIFMSFVAFNGITSSAWDGLRGMPNVQQVQIPTNASKILPGYYLFIGFCLSSILLSKKLEHGITSARIPPKVSS
ncbi:paraquat-inducible protein A [Telmatobacter sp. DSM 110680]|uniref:Paraquat-inducible protein A n=1 Tax=Telmatobacter sp. DSM 110680 TaxID=3036704 RepID=A0AAU7DJT9_9BACT